MWFKRRSNEFKLTEKIDHIAFIMDGNGRWAKARMLPRHLGHKEGCKRIIEILEACDEFNIKVVSLYAFSTENWKRPKDEIDQLFKYLEEFFNTEINRLLKNGTQVHIMGDISRLPKKTQEVIYNAINMTKHCKKHVFNICLNYGGRDEILKAVKTYSIDVLNKNENCESLTEEKFTNYLMSKGLPEVDLMIRTSGEQRISNYMLWQLAYAEFIFPKVPWPSFTRGELIKCLDEFQKRDRRYGGLKNE